MKPSGNTILITGGGSGIGAALARRLHDKGNIVIVAGRRTEALERTIAGCADMHARPLDLEKEGAIADFARQVIADFPALNVLINNAGVMVYEKVYGARALDDAEAMIITNLLGPIRLTDALVDHLGRQSDPAIVNVSSGLAFVPMIRAPTYSATKAAIHAYTVALREALRGKIEVIELIPPGVQTDLTPGQATRAGYQPLDEFADEVMTLLDQQPTPPEITVEKVKPLRFAEAEGKFPTMLAMLVAAFKQS
jgi:uncharacterized oxidoreductase